MQIHKIFDWDHISVIQYIILNNNWKDYTGIKLTKGNRAAIKDMKEYIKKLIESKIKKGYKLIIKKNIKTFII